MKHSKFTKALSVILTVVLLLTTVSVVAGAVGEFTAPDGMYLISNTQSKIAPGVTENKIITNKTDGLSQVQGYAVTVDMSKGSTATLMAGYADYNGSAWKMQTVRNQAKAIERKKGVNVVAGFNADIFNMQTGEPTNILVLDGNIVKDGIGKPYFAIMKDGTAKIGNSMTADVLKDVKEAVGGFYTILENGQRTAAGYSTGNFAPKTAVGIKPDGSVVVYVADGRNAPVSVGLHDYDLADIMLGLGCVDAINLDGGGSTTYAAKYEGSDGLEIANRPSDGIERVVSSSLFIVSSAKPTGEFDHASLTPNNIIYTPNSTVEFSAIGVDSAGGKADLPADGKFVLDSKSFGTITDDGQFVSTGKTGTVVVNYVSGGKVVGSTSIEVQTPDSIYFDNDDISLGFEKESDLGLNVKYQNRDVVYKDGDIIWSMDDERMGKFFGNTFISSDSNSLVGKIYAVSAFDSNIGSSITANIGKLPSVVWDFENPDNYVFTTSLSAPDAENATMLINGYGRGAEGTAEVVTKENGFVRHGSRALKISYDLANWNGVTDGICIGPTNKTDYIEGTPTGIGMWVYAPEGTPNFWLRMYYFDAVGQQQVANFTEQRKEAADGIGGINWTGWKYVEAPITGSAPYRFFAGQTIRLMALSPAGNEHGLWTVTGGYEKDADGNDTNILNKKSISKTEAHGSIYVDNVQFVYGANVDDIDNPVIDNVQIGNSLGENMQDITKDTVVKSNDVCIQSSFHDVENKYMTDINFDNVNVYLDGKDVTADSIILNGDYMVKYYTTLADGLHSVKILVRDGFNNETTDTRYFTVKGGVEYPTVKVAAETEKCILNSDYTIALTSNDIKQVNGVKTNIKLDNTIVKSEDDLKINFANGFSGKYTYNKDNGNLSLEISGSAATNSNKIATITVKIPYNTLEGKKYTYRVLNGEITFNDPSIITTTFASAEVAVPIHSAYTVSSDMIIVGGSGANIYVHNESGEPVAGVSVYNTSDDSLIGNTDKNGAVSAADFANTVTDISLYAMKDGEYSFKYTTQSANPACSADGTPEHILVNASKDGSTSKSIAWLSNPLASAEKSVVKYALKADYEANGDAAFKDVNGDNRLYSFFGSSKIESNYITRINTVTLSGLKGNSEYVFRVGDGKVWSDDKAFSTSLKGGDTNFFVFGDIQATDTTNISNLMKAVANDGVDYDFGIQTGDSIETASIYSHWDDILEVFANDNIADIDLIHVLGNHEFMGDPNGDSSMAIYNLPGKEFYSVDYGNVHVSVINYTAIESNLDAALEWLRKDASASNATWKIVAMHVPPYNTNIGDSHAAFTEKFPKVAQEVGIDFVFSGHDHSYARTAPLTDLTVDEVNGITYFISGSSGEKSYGVTNNPEFKFEVATNEFSSIYISVSATDSKFTVNTYDVNGDSVSLFDSYTKEKQDECSVNGHKYQYDNGYLTCSVCGYTTKVKRYSGFATDAVTGKNMYFINGEVKKGWQFIGDDCYYFDENGFGVTGTKTIDGIKGYKFDSTGKQMGILFTKNSNGDPIGYRGGALLHGWCEDNGNLYYFSTAENGIMRTGTTLIRIRTGQKLEYEFSRDGKLIKGAFLESEDGTLYYWGNEAVSGWQEIDREKYYFEPGTGFMAKDNTVIDGKIYAFSSEGIFMHEGAHEWKPWLDIVKPNCTVDGEKVYVCSICEDSKIVVTPAPGHVDADGDGKCDVCGRDPEYNSDSGNFFYRIINKLLVFYRWIVRVFNKMLGKNN